LHALFDLNGAAQEDVGKPLGVREVAALALQYARAGGKRTNLWDLRDLVLDTSGKAKEALPWLKLAIFGDKRSGAGSLRTNENVTAISGVEMDYDQEEISFEAAFAKLKKAGIQGLVYTSPSYREEAPRWRVICPTSELLPPNERLKLAARLNGIFDGVFGPESFTLSQSYYFGHPTGSVGRCASKSSARRSTFRCCLSCRQPWI
jgi:hypothetical protein